MARACSRRDCLRLADRVPWVVFWALGEPSREDARAASFALSYPVCAACARNIRCDELFTPESWAKIAASCERAGTALPDPASAQLRWFLLNPNTAVSRALELEAAH